MMDREVIWSIGKDGVSMIVSPRWNASEWALAPVAPRLGEVACLVVSCRLRDPIEEVADIASRPLIGEALCNFCTCRASDAQQVAHGSGRRLAVRALA